MPHKFYNLKNKKFGRLKVLCKMKKRAPDGCILWKCICDCSNIVYVSSFKLRNGYKRSCGCLQLETRLRHGQYGTRLYFIWNQMKQRCYNKNQDAYRTYGRRGIKICRSWYEDFQTFYDWAMSNGYTDKLTIDRINNDRG